MSVNGGTSIHSLNKYLRNTDHVPGAVLGALERAVYTDIHIYQYIQINTVSSLKELLQISTLHKNF